MFALELSGMDLPLLRLTIRMQDGACSPVLGQVIVHGLRDLCAIGIVIDAVEIRYSRRLRLGGAL